jgi:predicted DNA-binding transcriptional regulator AlpA
LNDQNIIDFKSDSSNLPKINSHQVTTGLLRLKNIIGDPKATPPILALIPVGRTTWLNGVKSGIYPKKINLSPRTVAWRSEDIYELINRLGKAA